MAGGSVRIYRAAALPCAGREHSEQAQKQSTAPCRGPRGPSLDVYGTSRRYLDEPAVAVAESAFGCAISMPPLKKAPSSITIPAVFTSPTRWAPLRRTMRSDASMLPFTVPDTMISVTLTLAFTFPLGPMVK